MTALACSNDSRAKTESTDEPAQAAATRQTRRPPRVPDSGSLPSTVRWQVSEPAALAESKKSGRPLFIDFTAKWCVPCQEMDATTFRDARVQALVNERFVALKIDATDMDDDVSSLMKKYGAKQLPFMLVRSSDAERLREWHEFVPATRLIDELSRLLEGAR